jgi:hypothetical protein
MHCNVCKYCKETFLGSSAVEICQFCELQVHPFLKNYIKIADSINAIDSELIFYKITENKIPVHFVRFVISNEIGFENSHFDIYVSNDKKYIEKVEKIKEFIENIKKNERQN